MTVGDKIKKIRTFRGMTQKELGLAVGFEEKGADNRIAQYETNYRVPKRELRRWTKGYTIKQPNMDCQPTEITALMRHRAVFS